MWHNAIKLDCSHYNQPSCQHTRVKTMHTCSVDSAIDYNGSDHVLTPLEPLSKYDNGWEVCLKCNSWLGRLHVLNVNRKQVIEAFKAALCLYPQGFAQGSLVNKCLCFPTPLLLSRPSALNHLHLSIHYSRHPFIDTTRTLSPIYGLLWSAEPWSAKDFWGVPSKKATATSALPTAPWNIAKKKNLLKTSRVVMLPSLVATNTNFIILYQFRYHSRNKCIYGAVEYLILTGWRTFICAKIFLE